MAKPKDSIDPAAGDQGSDLSSAPREIAPDTPQASRDLIAMSPEQFQMLLTAIAAKPGAPGTADQTNATLADGILKLIQNQTRGQRQENAVYPEVSVFSYPEGNVANPKPHLSRTTWFCGMPQKEDFLTPMEILAFNNIQTSRRANQNTWTASVIPGVAGAIGELHVHVPSRSHDDLVGLPSLLHILTQLATGAEEINVQSLFEEVTRLRAEQIAMQAKIASLSGETGAAPAATT